MKKILLFAIAAAAVTGCKKDYTCTCTDPSAGVVATFTIKDKKGKASEQCNNYYSEHYGNVPFNQTSCELK